MTERFKCQMKKTFKWSLLIFVLQLLFYMVLLMVLACFGMKELPEPFNTMSNIIMLVNIFLLIVSPFLGWYDEMVENIKEFLETDC